jgi:tripartite-type tricarboxylate transporter receptor subunit TctC
MIGRRSLRRVPSGWRGHLAVASDQARGAVRARRRLGFHQPAHRREADGAAPVLADLLSGNLHVLIGGTTAMPPYIKNGQLRGLAVSSSERLAAAPDIPSYGELPRFGGAIGRLTCDLKGPSLRLG